MTDTREYQVTLPIDPEAERLLFETVHEIGGTALKLPSEDDIPAVEVIELAPIGSLTEFDETMNSTFPVIPRETWDYYAVDRKEISKNWATRSWNNSQALLGKYATAAEEKTLDLDEMRAIMRDVESGERKLHGMGSTAWNLAAELNNMCVELAPYKILAWDPDIHVRFRSPRKSTRETAAGELQAVYAEFVIHQPHWA